MHTLVMLIPASRQYDEDWNVPDNGEQLVLLQWFQPVASMMRIETDLAASASALACAAFQPVASMMRIETK